MSRPTKRATPAPSFDEQRLADLEGVCRGLSHEANNWLYTILGQTEMAEQLLWRMGVAFRYAERQLERAERLDGAVAQALPSATIAQLRQQISRKAIRRRLDGLRKARRNAQQLSGALHHLHAFAAGRRTLTATVDLNAAVRGGIELVKLGYYRSLATPPEIVLSLADGLPPASASAGLVMGILIDLAASDPVTRLAATTRREGEAVVCVIGVTPSNGAGFEPALAAARLCGGTIVAEPQADSTDYALWLPTAPLGQDLRSGKS